MAREAGGTQKRRAVSKKLREAERERERERAGRYLLRREREKDENEKPFGRKTQKYIFSLK